MANNPKTGLEDPRAVEILTTEHWSLLPARSLGYQEVIGRTTIFVSILSATVVALAVLTLSVTGMDLLRKAYVQIVPELKPYFVTSFEPDDERERLGYGSRQRLANLANSLTTTSSVVAALNSVLAGALASDVGALSGAGTTIDIVSGVIISLASGALHVAYAARFRSRHSALNSPRAR